MEKIQVALRVRPFTQKELKAKQTQAWKLDLAVDQARAYNQALYGSVFNFDKIFNEKSKNQDVYENSCKQIVMKALDGVDTTLFVYGQTGSGKTHTMLGPPTDSFNFNGVIFQSLSDIYNRISSKEDCEEFVISCSYIEIYNDQIYDLLSKPDQLQNHLQIHENTEVKKFVVQGKTQVKIENLEEVFKILKYGETNRNYAETYFNHKSSRSHTIFSVHVRNTKIADNAESYVKESTINFVDLAGNERLQYEYKMRQGRSSNRNKSVSFTSQRNRDASPSATDFYNLNDKKARLQESKHINKSLFFLTQVIFLVSKGKKSQHIPFRNSPLTKILRSSLGGNSRTVLILCISPCHKDFDISLSTLRFGKCAKKIENKVRANIISSYNKEAIQALVDEYERKISMFNDKIRELENNQVDFMSFQKNMKDFKKLMFEKMMNLNQNKKNIHFLDEDDEQDQFTDILINKVGLLFNVKDENSTSLNKLFEGKNCKNCKLQRINDKFKVNQIPKIFQKFKQKLDKESDLEDLFIQSLSMLNQLQQQNQTKFDSFKDQFQDKMKFIFDYIQELLNKIGNLKEKLSQYEDPKKLLFLTDEEIKQNYQKLKTVFKQYQEENMKRRILKQLNKTIEDLNEANQMQYQLPHQQELDEFDNFKNTFQQTLQQSFEEFKQNQIQLKEQFNKEIITKTQAMNQLIDKIYEGNYQIQDNLFKIQQDTQKRFNFFEKKFEWLYKKISSPNQNDQPKKKLQRRMSEGEISAYSTSQINQSQEKNEIKNETDHFFYYNMLNQNISKMKKYQTGINELKDMQKNSLNKNFESLNQSRGKSQTLPELPQVNNHQQNESVDKIEEIQYKETVTQFHSQKEVQSQKLKEEQNMENDQQGFDISQFVGQDIDLDIDLNKFKIGKQHKEEPFEGEFSRIDKKQMSTFISKQELSQFGKDKIEQVESTKKSTKVDFQSKNKQKLKDQSFKQKSYMNSRNSKLSELIKSDNYFSRQKKSDSYLNKYKGRKNEQLFQINLIQQMIKSFFLNDESLCNCLCSQSEIESEEEHLKIRQQRSRMVYSFGLTLLGIFMFFIKNYAENVFWFLYPEKRCYQNTNLHSCFTLMMIYRISFTIVVYHLIMMIMSGIRNKLIYQFVDLCWTFKIIMFLEMFFITCLVPNNFFSFFAMCFKYLIVFFIIFKTIILDDAFFFYFNKNRFAKSDQIQQWTQLWRVFMYFLGIIGFGCGITIFTFCFIWFDKLCAQYIAINITFLCLGTLKILISFIKYRFRVEFAHSLFFFFVISIFNYGIIAGTPYTTCVNVANVKFLHTLFGTNMESSFSNIIRFCFYSNSIILYQQRIFKRYQFNFDIKRNKYLSIIIVRF